MSAPEVSVIIATRNRASSLEKLLASLQKQINPPSFEVVIADNGSSDKTSSIIAQASRHLPIDSIYVEKAGKGLATNAAIRIAKGKLVVFTDDDIEPHPDWLRQMHSATDRRPEINIFGGQIEVNTNAIPKWILKSQNLMGLLTSAHHYGSKDAVYDFGHYPFGPNMAIRRKLLADTDSPYPENIGPGTDVPVGDETVFLQQFSLPDKEDRMYIPSALVWHRVEPENLSLGKTLRRCFLGGRSHSQFAHSPSLSSGKQGASTLSKIGTRLASCRSIRELACITSRFLGYLYGLYLAKPTGTNK